MRRFSPLRLLAAIALLSTVGLTSLTPVSAATVHRHAPVHVKIVNSGSTWKFKPAKITIKKGTKVVWTNATSITHTATVSKKLNTGLIKPKHKGHIVFTKTGKFSYHCSIHPFMTGKVVVKK